MYTISKMLVIGHRGARGLAPENTLEGFKVALQHKVDGVEFDVRVTKDGVPVLMHDDHIPVGENYLYIAKAPFKELKANYPQLATLEEALRLLHNKTRLIIEVKPEVSIIPVTDVIRNRLRNGLKPELITISSFDFGLLRHTRGLLPDIAVAVNEKWSGLRATRRARKLGTPYITMNQKWLWSGFIKSVARRYKLSTYTLNDPAKADKWSKAGLHAAITDNPQSLASK